MKFSVEILWKDIWDLKHIAPYKSKKYRAGSIIINILIACHPSESKESLHKNEVLISMPTLKPPMFNYAAFCKSSSNY